MKTVALLIIFSCPAFAGWKWTRHTRLAAATCAASAFDGWTTSTTVGNPALYEANPLFRGRNGGPSMMKVSIFKAVGCGAGLWIASKTPAKGGKVVDTLFVGGSAWFGAVSINNARLGRK